LCKSLHHHLKKSDEKHLLTVTLRERLKSSARYSRYVAIVTSVDKQQSKGKILLHFDKTQSPGYFSIGTKLRISGKIALQSLQPTPTSSTTENTSPTSQSSRKCTSMSL
jgi:competence protein ComEC